MRFIILLFSVLLVSCATPKTAPQAYYGGVYVPGKVDFVSGGSFKSTAGVISADDLTTAKKAAYARLMVSAKAKGYKYFKITNEVTTSGLGKTFHLSGRAYKQASTGKGVYAIDAIRRVLDGLPLEEPRPVVKPKPRVAAKNVAKKVAKPAAPVVEKPVVTEDPTVIMAPEDITGSIGKDGVSAQTTSSVSSSTGLAIVAPKALDGVPMGVIVKQN